MAVIIHKQFGKIEGPVEEDGFDEHKDAE